MPVAVRNMTKTTVVYTVPNDKSGAIEWGYHGIPDGSDIQEVPEDVWGNARIRRAVAKGILAETTQEAMDAAFEAQRRDMQAKSNDRMNEVLAAMENPGLQIVLSADEVEAHIERVARSQPSEVLSAAERAAVEAQDQRAAALAAAVDPTIPITPISDPMTAVNAAVTTTQE